MNVSSRAGVSAFEGQTAYCASKFGIEAFTRCLAQELAGSAVSANTVTPGLRIKPTSITRADAEATDEETRSGWSDPIELGPASDVYVQHIQEHVDGFLIAATSGNPNQGKLHLLRRGDKEPFSTTTNLSNCHHISIHPSGDRLAVTTTSPGSNGNGRPLKDGNYVGNHSRVHLLAFPQPEADSE